MPTPRMVIMKRHALTDIQWDRIKDFFPANGNRGNQWKDHRLMVDGMIWVLKTGVPWRDLPERFGPWKTVYERFRLYSQQGLWQKIISYRPYKRRRKQNIAQPVDVYY